MTKDQELEAFADIENSELGEYWSALAFLMRNTQTPEPLKKILDQTIDECLVYIKENFRVVTHQIPAKSRTVRFLEHKNE